MDKRLKTFREGAKMKIHSVNNYDFTHALTLLKELNT